MAILESVKKLAEKLGAETNGRDITDQLNKINKHLDKAALSGRDIAEAVKTYSKNAGGGGAFNKIEAYGDTNGRVIIINVDSDEVTVNPMTDSGASFSRSIKKLIISGSAPKHTWIFAPTNDFDGIYKGKNKLTFTGDIIVPGEGVYKATIDEMGGTRTIQTLFSGTRVPFEIL